MKTFLIFLALACGSAFGQLTVPTPATSASGSPVQGLTTEGGAAVTITPQNTTAPNRPNNAIGGVVHMSPTVGFVINAASAMKPVVGSSEYRVTTSSDPGTKSNYSDEGSGQFRTVCKPSHMGRFDPLVYPGLTMAGHFHTFFGNSDVNGSLTDQTLGNLASFGRSTCDGGIANRTGYWVPSLANKITGKLIRPTQLSIYYKAQAPWRNSQPTATRPFPSGLRIIAGSPSWTDGSKMSTPYESFHWNCSDGGPRFDHIPTTQDLANNPNICGPGSSLEMGTPFPECWDGINLDVPGHQAHMAYQQYYTGCPSTHPVALPEIKPTISYSVVSLGGRANIPLHRLSSDSYSMSAPGGYSMHMDWINGWDPYIMQQWVVNCDQSYTDCHTNNLDSYNGREPHRLLY